MTATPDWEKLFAAAGKARQRAYAPYSKFCVGAAALMADGAVFAGCNMENASYGLSVCAERHALAGAIGAGSQKLVAMAVVADGTEPCPPCGVCRQVMAEFGPASTEVRFRNGAGEERSHTLGELLPHAFGPGFL